MLPELLAQIASDEPIGRVSADGAYDTRACHAAIAKRGAMAVIPTRKNGKPWKKWSGYHRRSLVETKMHCFKRLGQRVMARTFERQAVELHIRVALLNRFSQIGRPNTVACAPMP